jgi:uncharacterized protein involved in response to NO
MGAVFLKIDEPRARIVPGWALWALGFRPFYLLAALQAALVVPLWALEFSGWLPTPALGSPVRHAHEMVFGYCLAVIVGFLFTAGRSWSGQPTPSGRPLLALAALWLLARLLVLTPWTWASLAANVALPWLAAWGLWRALHAGSNRRNHFFVGLLVVMGLASGVVHLGQLQLLQLPGGFGLPLGLDIVLFMIAVMAGRVVPMFSNNGVPGLKARRDDRTERVALGSVLLLLALDALGLGGWPLALACMLALAAHGRRWWLWQPWGTLRKPLVWVLHAAYGWLLIHLLLRAGAALGWLPAGPATHALTIGVIGTITLGMITRTALGHTGRPLRAGAVETTAYLAMLLAAAVRVFLPLLLPQALLASVQISALLWSLAFALYLWRYTPMLLRTRLDGQPG